MESLLNAEVIKAAAGSPLGIIALMSLILGVIALAFFKTAPVKTRLIVLLVFVIAAVGFGYAALHQKTDGTVQKPEVSEAFVVGRWQVNQKVGALEGGSVADYHADGSFIGRQEIFVNGQGRMQPFSGKWTITKLKDDEFRLTQQFANGFTTQGVFRIVDQNRVHNIDENYDAVRIPR